MALEGTIQWEVVHGVSDEMLSEFKTSVFFTESQVSLEGVVKSIVEGRHDSEENALKLFLDGHYDEYVGYIVWKTGDARNAKGSVASIREFVEATGRSDEFMVFRAENEHLWNGEFRKDEVRQSVIDDKIVPLFEQLKKNSIYIFRDSDHCGVHLTRIFE